jgi:hypothetical protein
MRESTAVPAPAGPTTHHESRLKHVVESQQFTVPLLMELFDRSRGMERIVARGGSLDYQNRIMATLFYAPPPARAFPLKLLCTAWGAESCRLSTRACSRRKWTESRSKTRFGFWVAIRTSS